MYIALKILHVAAVVIFLGNLVTGILWKLHGDETKDPVIIAGFGAALIGGLPLLRTRWILAGTILFAISGLAYTRQVVPLQRQMLAVARSGVESATFDWDEYRALSRRWNVWGTIALIAPVLAMIGMIAKP